MFGILYTLFGLGASGGNKIKEGIEDEKNRNIAKKNGRLTYYGKGGERLTSNGKLISYSSINYPNGDNVIRDMHTGKIYINLSENKRQEIMDKAKKEGRTVVNKGSCSYDNPFYEDFKSKWWYGDNGFDVNYIDIESKKYLRLICINGYYFYMDIDTGFIIRKSDPYSDKHQTGNLSEEEIIELFNKRQRFFKGKEKIIQKKTNRDNRTIRDYYYLINCGWVTMDKSGKIYSQRQGIKKEITNII